MFVDGKLVALLTDDDDDEVENVLLLITAGAGAGVVVVVEVVIVAVVVAVAVVVVELNVVAVVEFTATAEVVELTADEREPKIILRVLVRPEPMPSRMVDKPEPTRELKTPTRVELSQ